MKNFVSKYSSSFWLFLGLFCVGMIGLSFPALAEADSITFKAVILQYTAGNSSFCWFCPVFGGIFDAMNNLSTSVSIKLSNTFLMVMGVGLLFSIAFKVGKMVTQLQAVDLMQFLTDMFKHLGRAIIATALLVSSLSIFTYLVSPVLSMSMGLTSIIMDEGGSRGTVIKAAQGTGITTDNICSEYEKDMKTVPNFSEQTKAFTPDVKGSLMCSLKTMSAGLIFGMALGNCIYTLTWTDRIMNIFPNPKYAILGVILILGHFAILVSFPFKLIDAMMRLAFICALMPLWIILWVFPATVGYTKKAWDMFVSSCLIFVCMAVVITLVMALMTGAVANREALIEALTHGRDAEAASMIAFGGKEFLVTCALCFIGFKMLGSATTLANSFTGSMPEMNAGAGAAQFAIKGAGLAGAGIGAGAKWGMKKSGMKPGTASKIGGWTVAGVLTGGLAPAAYGLFVGGRAAARKVFGKGSGSGGAAGNASTPGGSPAPGGVPRSAGGNAGGNSNVPPVTPKPPVNPTGTVPPTTKNPTTTTGTGTGTGGSGGGAGNTPFATYTAGNPTQTPGSGAVTQNSPATTGTGTGGSGGGAGGMSFDASQPSGSGSGSYTTGNAPSTSFSTTSTTGTSGAATGTGGTPQSQAPAPKPAEGVSGMTSPTPASEGKTAAKTSETTAPKSPESTPKPEQKSGSGSILDNLTGNKGATKADVNAVKNIATQAQNTANSAASNASAALSAANAKKKDDKPE